MKYAIEALQAEAHKWLSVKHEAERQLARGNEKFQVSLDQSNIRLNELELAIEYLRGFTPIDWDLSQPLNKKP